MRSGHAPGHIRETFLDAIEAYAMWSFGGGGTLLTVAREINYEPQQSALLRHAGWCGHPSRIVFELVADDDRR